MSRRAKLLLITALFLVLLGIPTAYVAFTWHPVQSLRFRLVQEDIERARKSAIFEVENTSAVPMHLRYVWFINKGDVSHPATVIGLFERKVLPRGGVEIPAGGKVRIQGAVRGLAPAHQILLQECRIEYAAQSETKHVAETAIHWLRTRVPSQRRAPSATATAITPSFILVPDQADIEMPQWSPPRLQSPPTTLK